MSEKNAKGPNKGLQPPLRFPEFEGDWVEKRLGEIVEFKITNSFSRENLNYETGAVKNIHYGDIHTRFRTLFDIKEEKVPFINNSVPVNRISADNYCKEGDLIFADASEDLNDVGKSIEIINLNDEKLVAGLHTLLARPNQEIFHRGFAGFLFKSENIRTQIQKEAQGTKVLSISAGRLSKTEINYPLIAEQEKITSLLQSIDARLSTQIKIIEALKVYRSTINQQLLSWQIRFKKSDGGNFPDWDVKRLGEIATKKASAISANTLNENEGAYKIYGATGVLKQIDFYREK